VYLGPTKAAMAYFEALGYRRPDLVNPADFLMDAIAGTTADGLDPRDLFDHWTAHLRRQQTESQVHQLQQRSSSSGSSSSSSTGGGGGTSLLSSAAVRVLGVDGGQAHQEPSPACGLYEQRRQSGCLTVMLLVIMRSFVQQYVLSCSTTPRGLRVASNNDDDNGNDDDNNINDDAADADATDAPTTYTMLTTTTPTLKKGAGMV
jgi:hypothetical protein